MSDAAFLAARSRSPVPGGPAILGCPLDRTSTYRRGSDEAPRAIREASESIETYSPFLDQDLLDIDFADLGDLDLSQESDAACLDAIERTVSDLLPLGIKPLSLGGEHTITLPVVKALLGRFPDLVLIHADAHTDLRDSYEGSFLNHATVMRRIDEIMGAGRLIQLGIRSGTREEFRWMAERNSLLAWEPGAEVRLLAGIAGRPTYLSFDVDVLDPACMPGTGNPEPGGWFFPDAERLIATLGKVNLIGADVVELNPTVDPSGVGTITTARLVRELLLTLGKAG
jgi:agmatinase